MAKRSGKSFDQAAVEEAILEEVARRGYVNASVEQICRRSGISEAEFFAHYEDLEDAYCQLVEVFRDMIVERLFAAFLTDRPWREQMRAAAHAMRDFLEEDPRRKRYLYTEVFNAGERAQLIREEGIQLMAQLIDQGRQSLEDPGTLTYSTAEGIAGSLFQHFRTAAEEDADPDALIADFMYIVVAPYQGVDAALSELQVPELEHRSASATS